MINLSNPEIADLCEKLGLLIQAGMGLSDGLHLLWEEETKASLKDVLASLKKDVEEGLPLYQAFSQAGCFPAYVTGLLTVGEQVGRTEETLFALSHYYEEQAQMNRRLRNALLYPCILLLMMLVVILVLLIKVLPIFDGVYASLGGSLTGLAGTLLSLGKGLHGLLPVLIPLFCLCVGLGFAVSLSPVLRGKLAALFYRMGKDKGVFRKINDARFAQALSMAFQSGLSPQEGVNLAATVLKDSPAVLGRLEACENCLTLGEDLSAALSKSDMMPLSACRLLTLAMRAGKGDEMMEKIALRLSEEADQALNRKVAAIEPALVLITSLMVGAILLTVMLPLMHIMKAIG